MVWLVVPLTPLPRACDYLLERDRVKFFCSRVGLVQIEVAEIRINVAIQSNDGYAVTGI